MTRVRGDAPDGGHVTIDPAAVAQFFERRAARIGELGPTRAVIYQDKHADLAERRDLAEKARLLPLLALNGTQRVLDVACGTGRWVDVIAPLAATYHGLDLTPGLIDFARQEYARFDNVRFTVASVEEFTLESISETAGFDRILSAGVLIYLNDDQLARALAQVSGAMAGPDPLLLFREPVAQQERLSLVEHFSEDLSQTYNAIYRTGEELMAAFRKSLERTGLSLLARGDVFEDDELNNRAETRQEWFLWGRQA